MSNADKYHNGQNFPNGYIRHFESNKFAKNKEEDIDLKKHFYTIWNRKWIVIASILAFGLLAGLYAFSTTPIYESNGSLLITSSKSQPAALGGEGLGQLLSSSYGFGLGSTLANEMQVLRSRKLSNKIADSLLKAPNISNEIYPILFRAYPDDSTITSQDTVASRLRNNLEFNQVDKNAEVISVNYESPSPVAAASIVDIVMQEYISLSTNESRTSAQSAVSFLEKERKRINKNLYESEERLRKFMNNSNLVQVDAQTEELISHISKLEAQRQEAKAKLVAAESGIEQYEAQLNTIKPGLADQYADAVGPNLSRLQYQLAEFQIQKMQLETNNPALKKSPTRELQILNDNIKQYQSKIRKLTQDVLEKSDNYIGFLGGEGVAGNVNELNKKLIELKVQKNQYQAQLDILSEQINVQESFFNNLPDNIIELARHKRDVKINEELYAAVSQQYAETALMEQTQFGNGRVIDNGFIPENPTKPYTKLFILVGFIFGGILSCGFILMKEGFNEKIDGVEKLRSFNAPVLSVVPDISNKIDEEYDGNETVTVSGKDISTGLVTLLDSISPIAESYRRLQSNIIYSNPDKKLKSIMLTSSGKGEGKTTTIANLGVVLSEAGYKTLVVDTDLRRPNLHNMFGESLKPGLAEVIFDEVNPSEVINKTITPDLHILSAGREVPNPSAVNQSRAFIDLISNLETNYDILLIDTPPFGIITDASALARHTDGIIVVSRFNKTTKPQLDQTLEYLHRLKANVLGTVMTAFDYKKTNDVVYGSKYYKDAYREYASYEK